MQKREAVRLLRGRVEEWNARKRSGEFIPSLRRIDLSGADLFDVDLEGLDLTGADFRGATLRGVSLSGATLPYARFDRVVFEGCDLDEIRGFRARFVGSLLRGTSVDGAKLRQARMSGAALLSCSLDGANLRGADLRSAKIARTSLAGAVLADADLRWASLAELDFGPADVRGIRLDGAEGVAVNGLELPRSDGPFASYLARMTVGTGSPGPGGRTWTEIRGIEDAEEDQPLGPPPMNPGDPRTIPVWFGTTRRSGETNGRLAFSGKRSETLTLGRVHVSVPAVQPAPGGVRLHLRWIRRMLGAQPSYRAGDYVQCGDAQLTEDLRSIDAEAPALLYIHGYRTSMDRAVLTAAQFGCDLNIGRMTLFSWPSADAHQAYAADVAACEGSERALESFILLVANAVAPCPLNILAHSMGNRIFLRALQRVVTKVEAAAGPGLGQVILAAPDVDRDSFLQVVPTCIQLAQRATMYVSGGDVALAASSRLHGAPRVGYTPPVTVLQNLDTIEVSAVDTSLLGHGYHANHRAVLSDMHYMLHMRTPPERRFALVRMQCDGSTYWQLK